MNITFTSKDGYCPYFIYKDTKFYIQDSRDYKGEWVYCLMQIDLKTSKLNFEDKDKARDFVTSKKVKYIGSTEDKDLYSDMLRAYIIQGKEVVIRQEPRPLSGDFDSYLECLEFAKKHVSKFIEDKEPQQISLL